MIAAATRYKLFFQNGMDGFSDRALSRSIQSVVESPGYSDGMPECFQIDSASRNCVSFSGLALRQSSTWRASSTVSSPDKYAAIFSKWSFNSTDMGAIHFSYYSAGNPGYP